MILYNPQQQTFTRDSINQNFLNTLSQATINPYNSEYIGNYIVLSQSGNESLYDVDITKDEKTGNSLICLEAGFDNREVEVYRYDDRIGKEVLDYSYNYIVPNALSFYKTEKLSRQDDLIRTRTNELSATSPTNPNRFCYEANPDKDYYLKFGDNSVVVIQENIVTTDSILNNVTAEGNFTHLNISTSAPYNSLIGYWNFDGDKTNTKLTKHYDWTKNNNDGTGVADALVNSAGCVYDDCLQLDGTGDFVNGGDIDILDNPTNFSFCIWVYHNSISDDDSILSKSYSATDGWLLFRDDVGVGGNDLYSFYIADSTGTDNVRLESVPGSSVLNSWTHVCGTYAKLSTTGLRLYVNGTEVPNSPKTLASIGGIDSTTYPFYIGYRDTSALPFNGTIDEVMVFNTTLTDAQILAIYNNQSARFLATGTQDINNQSYMNISTGNNRVNVTTYIENNLGSSINLSVGYYDVSETWAYTTSQIVNSGLVQTFTISSTSTNLTLNYTFYAGNSTNPFYSPIIKSNISFEAWNEVSGDTTPPNINFIAPTPANQTSTTNTSIPINVSIIESDLSEVNFNWNGTNYTIYNDSLVLMFNFENRSELGENSTYVVDMSRYWNNGTIFNAILNTSGRYGSGYQFDGNGDYIRIEDSNTLDFGSSSFSYSFWFNSAGTTTQDILCKQNGTASEITSGYRVLISTTSTTGFSAVFSNGTNNTRLDSGTHSCWGGKKWCFMTVVVDRGNNLMSMYLNGTYLTGKSIPAGSVANAFNLTLGAVRDGSTRFFNGSIDEVRMWNKTLSAQEIYQQYISNLQKYSPTQWYLYVNQSNSSSTGLSIGNYTYFASAKDSAGNENLTEIRTISIISMILGDCWTKTGNILYIPRGCVYQLNKGVKDEI